MTTAVNNGGLVREVLVTDSVVLQVAAIVREVLLGTTLRIYVWNGVARSSGSG